MKNFKRILVGLLVVIVAGLLGATKAYAGEFKYYVDEYGDDGIKEVHIYGYEADGTETALEIPEEINGYKVTYVMFCEEFDAFGFITDIMEVDYVSIPAGVRYFNNEAILTKSYVVDDNNENFYDEDGLIFRKGEQCSLVAFPALRAGPYILPDNMNVMYNAFNHSHLGEITISEDYLNAEADIWYYNGRVEECYIDAITNLVSRMDYLETINIPENDYIKMVNGNVYSKDEKILYLYMGKESEVTIPEGTEQIYNSAFYARENIIINKIILPSSVKINDAYPLIYLDIKEIEFNAGSPYIYEDGIIYTADKTKLIAAINYTNPEVVIGQNIREIGKHAFAYNKTIESIEINSDEIEIGVYAFYGCEKLKTVIISGGLKVLKSGTFSWCNKLEKLTLPDTLEEIEPYSIDSSTLRELVIPENVRVIGESAISIDNVDVNVYIEANDKAEIGESAINFYRGNIYVNNKNVYDAVKNSINEYQLSNYNIILNEPFTLDCSKLTLYLGNVKNTAKINASPKEPDTEILWKTSDKKVAKVSNGKVIAVGKGKAVITVTSGEFSKDIPVTVKEPVVLVTDGSKKVTTVSVKKGKSKTYRLYCNPLAVKISVANQKAIKKYVKVTIKNGNMTVQGLKKGKVKLKLKGSAGNTIIQVVVK